ncbi:Uncharacterised protein [Proteus vulgaris]|uniref:hypothetical protein n=1 Tax=Proteus TaxID=583 RepID=UPI000E00302D|nr:MULTISPECIES: hypothetical protein [Proteus]UDN35276.1 hypothetical protein LG402_16290 [Proteus sp. NMG38-2]SUC22743.1 Uncharacterised protein [Proteus vulgaris]
MAKEIKSDLGKYEDTLYRVKSFLETAQFLSRNEEERAIQLSLLSQAEDEIREALGYE